MTKLMLDTALRTVAGPLADLMNKLAAPDGNTKWLPALNRFLRQENPWDGKPLFAPWKTVQIGGHPSMDHLIQQLEDGGYKVTDPARTLLTSDQSYLSIDVQEVDFIRITPADIGLVDGADHHLVVLRQLKFFGLEPCPPEAVAELRLQCDEQNFEPEDKAWFEALMRPIKIDGEDHMLELNRDTDTGQLKLTAFELGDGPGPNAPFVCVQPRR